MAVKVGFVSVGAGRTGLSGRRADVSGRCGIRVGHVAVGRPRQVARRGVVRAAAAAAAAAAADAEKEAPKTPAPKTGFNPDDKKLTPRGTSLPEVLRFLFEVSRQERRVRTRMTAAVMLMVFSKMLNLVVPYMFKAAVDAATIGIVPPGILAVAPWLRNSVSAQVCVILIAAQGLFKLLSVVTHELRNVVFSRALFAIGRNVTLRSFQHIHNLEAAFHTQSRTGALVRIVDRGTRSVSNVFRIVLFSFFPSLLEVALVASVLSTQFAPAYAVVMLVTFVLFVAATLQLNYRQMRTRKELNLMENEASAKLNDSLTNFQTVKVFNNEEFERERYDVTLRELQKTAVRNDKEYALLNMVQGGIYTIGSTTVLLLSALDIVSGRRTMGDLVMASTLLQQMWAPLNFIGWQYRELRQTLVDMENLMELLQRQPVVTDIEGAQELRVKRGEVRFEDIRFRYDDGDEVLKGVTFTVPAGKTVAVVGPSGSGKSTLLGLLYRLHDATGGRILVDGQDIATVKLGSLRSQLGMIPQDTVLFNDTIEYNIAYPKPYSSLEEIKKAAELARIDQTIQRMPDGYHTKVGERGLRLSGGEKQRVAIARCMLKAPMILLQDEATSALDTKTEMEISDSLQEIGSHRTCIIVAHRLSTVVNADEIIVLRHGKIFERGTHAELIELGGSYYDMWQQQKSEVDKSLEETELGENGHNGADSGNGKSASETRLETGNIV